MSNKNLVANNAKNQNVIRSMMNIRDEKKAANVIDGNAENGIKSTTLREFYINTLHKAEQTIENAAWRNALTIASIVSSENFSLAFKDRNDLCATMGYSKGYVSKMIGAVEVRDKLLDMGYEDGFSVGQLSELVKYMNDQKSKNLSMIPALSFMGFSSSMTCREIRDGLKAYNDSIASLTDKKTDNEKTDNNKSDEKLNKPITSSIPSGNVIVRDVVDESGDKCATNVVLKIASVDNDADAEKITTGAIVAKNAAKDMSISFKGADNKKNTLKIKEEDMTEIFALLIGRGYITM